MGYKEQRDIVKRMKAGDAEVRSQVSNIGVKAYNIIRNCQNCKLKLYRIMRGGNVTYDMLCSECQEQVGRL